MDVEMQDRLLSLRDMRAGLSMARKERQRAQMQWAYDGMLDRVAEEVYTLKQIPLRGLHEYEGARQIRLGLEELAELLKEMGV